MNAIDVDGYLARIQDEVSQAVQASQDWAVVEKAVTPEAMAYLNRRSLGYFGPGITGDDLAHLFATASPEQQAELAAAWHTLGVLK